MKIQFASDLHLELSDNSRYLKNHPLEVAGDVLLLAGDTIYLGQESLMKHPFWRWAADHFEQVIAVPAQHTRREQTNQGRQGRRVVESRRGRH